MAAKSPFAPVNLGKNKLRNQQFGFSTGGPILRDKTVFFLTYEEQKFTIGNQSRSTEPSIGYQAAARQLLQRYSVQENPVSDALLATCGLRALSPERRRPVITSTRMLKVVTATQWPGEAGP